MNPTPDSTSDDPQQIIADLRCQLADAQRRLDEALVQQAASTEVLTAINSYRGDLAPVFEAILDKAMQLCGAAIGELCTYDGERFATAAIRGETPAFIEARAMNPAAARPGTGSRRVIETQRPLHILDMQIEAQNRPAESRAFIELSGMRTSLTVPLLRDETFLGFIRVYRREVKPFTDQQIALLENFAAQAVIAMESARLITETREALEQQTATAEVLGVINSSPGDLTPVFDAILEKAMNLCGAAFGALMSYDGERVSAVATRGLPPQLVDVFRQPVAPRRDGDAPYARFLRGESLLHIIDMAADDVLPSLASRPRALVEIGGARTGLEIPLRQEGAVLGSIWLYRQEVRPFTDKQIALLQNFAAQAVIAMENARLINETREALEQQTATAEVLQVINSSPGDLAPVFESMLEKATALCDAAFGIILTWDGDSFHRVAFRGVPDDLMEALSQPMRPVPGSIADRVVQGEQVISVSNLLEEDSYRIGATGARALADIGGARSFALVTLRNDNKLLGLISVYRQAIQPFVHTQITLLKNFAAQAVIAMENARLISETREALEQQTATAEVLGVINSSPGDLAPVFDAMLDKAMRLCDAAFGIMRVSDGEQPRTVRTRGVPAAYAEFLVNNPIPAGEGGIAARNRDGEPFVHTVDLKDSDRYRSGDVPTRRAMVDLGGARTSLSMALIRDRDVLGAIHLYRQEVRPFTDKQIALLQNFAAQAVIAMENARLITETREALEQQTATAEVLQVINSSPGDLAPVFDAMLEKAHSLCGAEFGRLFTYDGETFWPVATHAVSARDAEWMREGFRPAQSNPFVRVIEGAQIVHIADIRQVAAEFPDDRGLRTGVENGHRTFLVMPLRKDDVLLGVITAIRREVRPFSDKQIALLENFAAQAVIAIENARLITETREALEQQTATAEVLQVINSSRGDLAPVFDAILEKATRVCQADSGHLLTLDGEHLRTAAMYEVPAAFADFMSRNPPQPGPHTAVGRILRGERVVRIDDVTQEEAYHSGDPRRRATADLGGARSFVAVGLFKDNELLGTLAAYREEVRPFTDKQIALLQNFAAQAVIAIENARLLGELQQRTEEVEALNRDLEVRVAEQVDELGRVGRLKRFLAPQLAELIVSQGDEKILESHRREIVVVFCDLRGYTAFTETAEPEEVLDFLRQYHGALGPLVSQFEGTLDQFSGDGIMVFFNDPVPIPDPAERAVKMAVAMRSAANTLIADWRERGRDLGFGAGIAQGYATLGQIGFSERSGYTAIGTVCNVAARLCAEAKDGQILLGQRVNVALKGSLATEQLGPLTLKGLSQPVVAYNVPLAASQPALRVIEGGSPQTV